MHNILRSKGALVERAPFPTCRDTNTNIEIIENELSRLLGYTKTHPCSPEKSLPFVRRAEEGFFADTHNYLMGGSTSSPQRTKCIMRRAS